MPLQKHKGLLIVLEGIDGSGKTTLQHKLGQELRGRGHQLVLTKEPTDGPLGQKIRMMTAADRKHMLPDEEFGLFHADRLNHVTKVVRPALEQGNTVLQDRGYWSTVAYQGERGLLRPWLLYESRKIAPEPDLWIVIDVPSEVARARIDRERKADAFEHPHVLERLRDFYKQIPDALLLDGTMPTVTLSQLAMQRIADLSLTKRELARQSSAA